LNDIVIFQSLLVTFGNGVRLITALLLGTETEEFMMNPVLKSSSPSDFWGKRWNRLVQCVLKASKKLFNLFHAENVCFDLF